MAGLKRESNTMYVNVSIENNKYKILKAIILAILHL